LPGAAGDNHPIARHLLIMTDNAIDPRIALMRSADALHLSLTEAQAGALLSYLDLIQKWNKVYNLTAVRNPADMVTHHLLDSLAVIAPLGRQLALMRDGSSGTVPVRLLDVGSGGRTSGGGHCHLLPGDRRDLCRHGGQEGGVHPAGCGRAAIA
jgi:hypothetical protein